MGSMNPSIHKLSGRYCPHCLLALWQVISSGVEFCPGNPACDYEVLPSNDQLAPLTQSEKVERVLKNKQHEHRILLQQIADLQQRGAELARELTEMGLPTPAGGFSVAVMEGRASGLPEHEKRSMADGLHPDVNAAYGYVISVSDTCDIPSLNAWHGWALREAFLAGVSFAESRPASSEAPPPKFVVEQFHDEKGWVEIPGCSFATKELAVADLEHRERHHQQRDLQVVKVEVVTETVHREVRDLVKVGLPGMALPFRTGEGAH